MKKYFYLFLLVLIISCKANVENDQETTLVIECDVDKDTISIDSLDFVQDYKLIPLDNSKTIGEIDKVVAYDTLLYLLDRNQQRCVHIFSTSGKYINTISKLGHAADEYIDVQDVFINKENKTVNLLSRNSKKVLSFDLYGKEEPKIIKMPMMFTRVVKIDKGYIGYAGNYSESAEKYNYWILDENAEIVDKDILIDEIIESTSVQDMEPISVYKNRVYMLNETDYDINSYADKAFKKIYKLDFGERNYPRISSEDTFDYDKFSKLIDGHLSGIERFQETDNYLFTEFVYESQPYMFFYDKNQQRPYFSLMSSYASDCMIGIENIVGTDENHIYSIVSQDILHFFYYNKNEYVDLEKEYPNEFAKLHSLIPAPKEGDNPLLVIFTIK